MTVDAVSSSFSILFSLFFYFSLLFATFSTSSTQFNSKIENFHAIQMSECNSLEIYAAILNSFHIHIYTRIDFVICHLRRCIFLSRTSKWCDIDMESINIRRLKHPINAFKLTFTLAREQKNKKN